MKKDEEKNAVELSVDLIKELFHVIQRQRSLYRPIALALQKHGQTPRNL